MPPPEHVPVLPFFGVGPGAPHAPPYRHELAEGLTANDLVDPHLYPVSAFSARSGKGVYLVGMLVPQPGITGRSPDFESGRIVPNTVLPITLEGVAIRNGQLFDPFLLPESEIPPLDESVAPRFAGVEGYSHLPFFTADNQLLGPPGTPVQGGPVRDQDARQTGKRLEHRRALPGATEPMTAGESHHWMRLIITLF